MKKKLVIVLVTILLLIVCYGHFSCRYFLAQDKLKVEYRLNNMDEAVKDFLSKYNLTQPFLVLQNKEPRDLLTEIIIFYSVKGNFSSFECVFSVKNEIFH